MKKGQRVRVLRTNEIGTISDQVLINKRGKMSRYCQVKLDAHPEADTWYMEEKLGKVTEDVNITFTAENGDKMYVEFTKDHEKERFSAEVHADGKPLVRYRHTVMGEVLCMIFDGFYRNGMIAEVDIKKLSSKLPI